MHRLSRASVLIIFCAGSLRAQSQPVITTVAGSGNVGYSGDGGPATAANLNSPAGVAVDGQGNVYFGDVPGFDQTGQCRIRRIDTATGNITTIAGGGTVPYPNDGALATNAVINSNGVIALDRSGHLLFYDNQDPEFLLRSVDLSSGALSTIAGANLPTSFAAVRITPLLLNGQPRNTILDEYPVGVGDGGPASQSSLGDITDIKIDSKDNIYILTNYFPYGCRVRRIDAASHDITTVAGTGELRCVPGALIPDTSAVDGSAYWGDSVVSQFGNVSSEGYLLVGASSADGAIAASSAILGTSIAIDNAGNLYISEAGPVAVMFHLFPGVTTDSGTVLDLSGTSFDPYVDFSQPPVYTKGQVYFELSPTSLSYLDGDWFDPGTGARYPFTSFFPESVWVNRVRRVDAVTNMITTIGGAIPGAATNPITFRIGWANSETRLGGFVGEGGAATNSILTGPGSLTVDSVGNVLFADGGTAIRRIDAAIGRISTVAGSDQAGYSGDGGPAVSALLNPSGIAFDVAGDLFLSDWGNSRVRKITALSPPPGVETSAVMNVVSPIDPVTQTNPVQLTFSNVTSAGQTAIVTDTYGASPPVGFKLGEPPVYFTLITSATFTGSVQIQFNYSAYVNQFGSTELELFHGLPGGTWQKITTSNDTMNHILYGVTSSFSPFAVMEFAGPVANAGPDQSIHAGQTVHLDGSASYSSNASTDLLTYSWAITSAPPGSLAHLDQATAVAPSFVADLPGQYQLQLIVTDLDAVASYPDSVRISSLNQPPTAHAGPDVGGVVGQAVTLSGAASSDPDNDSLTYAWALVAKPRRSTATLASANTVSPTFTPDVSGNYTLQLVVNDGFASSAPDPIVVTVVTPIRYAEALVLSVIQSSKTLPVTYFTNAGNKKSFESLLLSASHAMQEDEIESARKNLADAILRTDGFALRGRADPTGSGRDWIVDGTTSLTFYSALTAALNEIAASDQPCHEHDHEDDD